MTPVNLFPFAEYAWLYFSFLGVVAGLLLLDLGVFHRNAHEVSLKEAAGWSVFWVSFSLCVNLGLYLYAGEKFRTDPRLLAIPGFDPQVAATAVGMEFLTGFLIEKALAVDNIFVFSVVFGSLGIPAMYQHRILFYGIVGAVVFRAIFVGLGAQLMQIHWLVVLFGVFLILTGFKMCFTEGGAKDPKSSWVVRMLSRIVPITPELHGQRFLVRTGAKWVATPLLVALVLLEVTDIVFAVDSVPAIFAITDEPMIVFMSNILAILGLRSMYFLLAGVMHRFVYLKYGLAAVLVFVGLKMVWLNQAFDGKFPIGLSLGIIAALIGGSGIASWWKTSRESRTKVV